jgi:hypothetical protein
LAAASLIISIIALIFSGIGFIPGASWSCYVGLVAGIAGIIMSAVALSHHRREGKAGRMAMWGLIFSIIAVIVGVIALIVVITSPTI